MQIDGLSVASQVSRGSISGRQRGYRHDQVAGSCVSRHSNLRYRAPRQLEDPGDQNKCAEASRYGGPASESPYGGERDSENPKEGRNRVERSGCGCRGDKLVGRAEPDKSHQCPHDSAGQPEPSRNLPNGRRPRFPRSNRRGSRTVVRGPRRRLIQPSRWPDRNWIPPQKIPSARRTEPRHRADYRGAARTSPHLSGKPGAR